MSTGRVDVLLLTADGSVAAAVDAALKSNGRVWTSATVAGLREMAAYLGPAAAGAVLVDLDPQREQVLTELERVTARHPSCRFIALTSARDQDLLMSAMQSGVRHVMLKQEIGAELPRLLQRLLEGGSATEQGELFTVLSAGGGCGASTICLNMADEMGSRTGRPTLLIDLDLSYGTLATVLGVDFKYGIDHLLSYKGTIDTHLISSTATPHGPTIHVLPSPIGLGLDGSGRVDASRLSEVLAVARQAYRSVVVDAPRLMADTTAMLVAESTRALLAMQLTVKDVRVARAMLAGLTARGVSAAAILPVVNRYARRQHKVSVEDAASALGVRQVELLRNDYPAALHMLDFGQTLSMAAPRSVLRRDLQALVAKIAAPVARVGA